MAREGKLQKKLLARARKEKMFAHKVVSESYDGFPDTLFIRKLDKPKLVNYELVMLELKATAKSDRSAAQVSTGEELDALGVTFAFIDDYAIACEILELDPSPSP